ncbi:hypothetical protein [Novilysobacter erysipheiresistens]|uniref:Secreted protein n=1 Tax=Novilysobacter erysipheiresistens TaxID=1749332 RepID=A0ABU7Z2D7_9GAMM
MNGSTRPIAPTSRLLRSYVPASVLLAVLFAAPLAFAQQAGERIEQQMTPDQFKAAGLDQLSAEQLENLNAWLNRTLVAETTKAATVAAQQAKEKIEDENRGFLNFGSDEAVTGRLQGEFRGFGKGREYLLDNGQLWRQTDSASLAGVRLDNPQVTIKPSMIGSAWYLTVEGYNTAAKVQRIK